MNPVLAFFLGLAVIPLFLVSYCVWLYLGLNRDVGKLK